MTCILNPNIVRRKLMNIISDMKQHPEGFVMNPGRDVFGVVKNLFRCRKTRYRGKAKVDSQLA